MLSEKTSFLLYVLVLAFLIYIITREIFNFLLRGFAPFLISRPWVIKQVLDEIDRLNLKVDKDFSFYSIGSGRSGLLYALEKKFPQAQFYGVEDSWWSTFLSRLQLFLKKSKIKVLNQKDSRRLNFKDVDLIYCRLDVKRLRDISNKLKFECKPGTIVISNGLNIPALNPIKILELDDKKGRFAFLSKNRKLWVLKSKKEKRENKVYFYEI